MKNIFIVLAVVLIGFTSCKKEATATERLDERLDTSNASTKGMGSFINGPYGTVSGQAKIFVKDEVYTLQLTNMNISNGPDLHVYLSKEQQPVNFIDLGKLKSTMGNQVYSIPGKPDFTVYKYALVHCQQYNHLFGSAILQ
jgi:hypothetical protein